MLNANSLRLSMAVTLAPLANKNRTQERPVRPIPSTTICLFAKDNIFTLFTLP
jgi:hypothetical protein